MPTIRKIKIMASPNMPKEKIKDMLGHSLHVVNKLEDEMNGHPFGHKLMAIGKPMMMGGLHNVMDMMTPDVIPHLCHHLDHHPEHHHGCHHHHGPKCCIEFMNNICRCIILFFIWKIFESINCRCHGFSESKVLKKFKYDLNEQYGKINKIHSLLNESTLTLNEEHIAALKIQSLIMLSEGPMAFAQQQFYGSGGLNGIVANLGTTMNMNNISFQKDIFQALAQGKSPDDIVLGLITKAGWEIIKGTPAYKQAVDTAKATAKKMVANAQQALSNAAQDTRNAINNTIHAGNPNYIPAQRTANGTIGGYTATVPR